MISCTACVAGRFHARLDFLGAGVHRGDRTLGLRLNAADHVSDLLGRLAGSLGQLPHFVGHHRESAPLFPGARGFDGSVQGQQIGLVGDVVDDADDLANLVRPLA
jgi:hypothetical protein